MLTFLIGLSSIQYGKAQEKANTQTSTCMITYNGVDLREYDSIKNFDYKKIEFIGGDKLLVEFILVNNDNVSIDGGKAINKLSDEMISILTSEDIREIYYSSYYDYMPIEEGLRLYIDIKGKDNFTTRTYNKCMISYNGIDLGEYDSIKNFDYEKLEFITDEKLEFNLSVISNNKHLDGGRTINGLSKKMKAILKTEGTKKIYFQQLKCISEDRKTFMGGYSFFTN